MDKSIIAAVTAATANVNWLTNDNIEALTRGHGMLNIPVYCVANVLAEELLRGADIALKFANVSHLPVEDVLAKAIEAAEAAGADSANAALISAVMLYFAGTKAQAGVPAGNRKLGALARIIAKVDRCGVATIPTGKISSKISGFPAVQAIYQAMASGTLSPVSGRQLPEGIGGSAIYGHSTLGEDIVFPALAANGARVATQGMLDAMAGAGMLPHPFTAALFGAAAILEIVHPDAAIAEQYGSREKTNTAYLAGKTAVETAKLPAKIHMRVTGEEYDTARVIGDLGLILKDVGGPSVIGMMALNEIVAAFSERLAGSSGGPRNPPLGHICADAVVAMKALLAHRGDQDAAGAGVIAAREGFSVDPETAMVAMNTVARKAAEVRGGPVTETLIMASEPTRVSAIYRRALKTHQELAAGRTLAEVVRDFDTERQTTVEQRCSVMLSKDMGKDVIVRVTKLGPAARRKGRTIEKYWVFDAYADVSVTVDGKTTLLAGVIHDLVPKATTGERSDIRWAIPLAAPVLSELYVAGNTIINATVPAAVAVAMGLMSPEEAALEAERAAFITGGIPGTRVRVEQVAKLAARIAAHG